jgi:hypothetical protein
MIVAQLHANFPRQRLDVRGLGTRPWQHPLFGRVVITGFAGRDAVGLHDFQQCSSKEAPDEHVDVELSTRSNRMTHRPLITRKKNYDSF